MTVRHRGVRKARPGDRNPHSPQTYDYHSPGVTFECEKLLDKPKELAKLSSEVRIIQRARPKTKEE